MQLATSLLTKETVSTWLCNRQTDNVRLFMKLQLVFSHIMHTFQL